MKKVLLSSLLFASLGAAAQNVGINSTGAAAVTSAALDVDMANKGVLIPRVALTTTTAFAPVTGVATASLLVYNTATAGTYPANVTPGFYYWTGSAWARMMNSGTSWELLGNQGTSPTTNFLGTTDAVSLVFRTSNTPRAVIYGTGEALFNPIVAGNAGDMLAARATNTQFAVSGYLTGNGAGNAGFFENDNTNANSGAITSVTSTPVYNTYILSTSSANTTPAGISISSAAAGIGFSGSANTAGTYSTVPTGAGGVFTHGTVGVYGSASSSNGAYGGYFANGSTYSYVGYRTGGVNYKVLGTGTASTIVDDADGKKVIMFCPEAPEVLFQDYGTGTLSGGTAHIAIDPNLSKNIFVDAAHPLKVFIQLEGECQGVYVTNKSANGFDVIELQNGSSNVPFSWTIVASRANTYLEDGTVESHFQEVRFPDAPSRVVETQVKREGSFERTPIK